VIDLSGTGNRAQNHAVVAAAQADLLIAVKLVERMAFRDRRRNTTLSL
jgi:hypothetical protein